MKTSPEASIETRTKKMATVRKPPPPHIVIVGGGLAGLAVASCLVDRGLRITILESRPRLGGRASSFPDPATGELVDNCQHVSMACCTNLADFCRRVGIGEMLRREPELVFLGPDGTDLAVPGRPRAGPVPPGRQLPVGAVPEARATSCSVAYGLACLAWDRDDRPGESFADWLLRHRQSLAAPSSCSGAPVLVSALNERLDQMDVGHARKVFLDGFLRNRTGFQLELPLVPLGELYGTRLEELAARSTRSRSGSRPGSARSSPMTTARSAAWCSARASRSPPTSWSWPSRSTGSDGLIPDGLRDRLPALAHLGAMQASPITGVHLWFDRPVCPFDHVVTPGRLIQWVFNHTAIQGRTATAGVEPPERRQPGARRRASICKWSSAPRTTCWRSTRSRSGTAVLAELAEIWPAARAAKLLRWWVVTEHGATFAVRPGIEALRPPQRTPIDGLFLAGDWTDTGWPATMEGAVRSGYLAAQEILTDLDRPTRLIRPGLPSGPARPLALRRGRVSARPTPVPRPRSPAGRRPSRRPAAAPPPCPVPTDDR